MKRWNTENINTPQHFDKIWPQWEGGTYNAYRMEVMVRSAPEYGRILDAGAGYLGCGMYMSQMCQEFDGEIVAVDFSIEAARMTLRDSGSNLQYVVADVRSLPFPDSSFHHAFLGETIEHMEDPVQLLKEIERVLAPDSFLCLSSVDMHCQTAQKNGCRYPDHVWDFTQDSLEALCRQVFVSVEIGKFGNYYIGWMR